MQESYNKPNWLLRIISASMIFIVFALALWISNNTFILLMLMIIAGMLFEWHSITKSNISYWSLAIFLPLPIICLIIVKLYFPHSSLLIFWYFLLIWTNDAVAMIAGRSIGGPKLAPVISPNKTWSGFIFGVLIASILGVITNNALAYLFKSKIFNLSISSFTIWLIGLMIAIVAQISDLSVSLVKRKFKVKDSGSLIPGHGGVLDRFDSIILTAPILLLISILTI